MWTVAVPLRTMFSPLPSRPSTRALHMPIMAELRSATLTQHRAIRTAAELLRPDAGDASYRRLLERLHGYFGPLERQLSQVLRGLVHPVRLRKAMLIESDLHALGLTEADIELLPTCTELPTTDTMPAAFGCLYVTEGSTIGMRHLLRSLPETRCPAIADASRFMDGYGESTEAMWTELATSVESAVTTRASAQAAVRAARQTFDLLHRWLHIG
jgi:heme oxygenase (biliverdin-IX-beta and delta-forming)